MTRRDVGRLLLKFTYGDGCWEWTGTRDGSGYGMFWLAGRMHRAHRAAYRAFCGAIPEGRQLDHLCRNRACVRPDHLEVVTSAENARRSHAHRTPATHCKRGHAFAQHGYTNSNGSRTCRICGRARWREYYYRTKART